MRKLAFEIQHKSHNHTIIIIIIIIITSIYTLFISNH